MTPSIAVLWLTNWFDRGAIQPCKLFAPGVLASIRLTFWHPQA